MDLLRSTVKCLLYDWPIEPVAEYVFNQGKDSRAKENKAFRKRFT